MDRHGLPSAGAATSDTSEAPYRPLVAQHATNTAPGNGPPIRSRSLLIAGLTFVVWALGTAHLWFAFGLSAPIAMEQAFVGTASGGNEYQTAEANSTAVAALPSTGQHREEQPSRNSTTATKGVMMQGQANVCASNSEQDMDYYNGQVSAADSQTCDLPVHRTLFFHRLFAYPSDL